MRPVCNRRCRSRVGGPVPAGTVGELVLRSATVMKGYWNNPEATRAAFFPGGWLHTGDAAYLDEDGYVYVHDRVRDMIISSGENVYPAEVENALFGHPAVADVAVIGVPDEECGELEASSPIVSYGWGMIPVTARIGATGWTRRCSPRTAGTSCR